MGAPARRRHTGTVTRGGGASRPLLGSIPGVEAIMSRTATRAAALFLAVVLAIGAAACGKTVGETIDDATITTRVKTALLNDPDVGGLRIDVDTTMGVVTLNGVVKSKDEEAKAMALARKITG